MCPLKRFEAKDIGGELLPIITRGLYRNPLDAFREYIQNSIDAEATNIELSITPDLISIKDDGKGMNQEMALNSIRLGISEKNPNENVGFRGIGIYSAFDLCSKLEIYTKSQDDQHGYIITMNFDAIKNLLELENIKKTQGIESKIYLETLLSQSVLIEKDVENIVTNNGTLVLLVGLKNQFCKKLNNIDEVKKYLQDVIPLPFSNKFKFRKKINQKFEREDYRMVKVLLRIGEYAENLFRPYDNKIFDHGGLIEPEFFNIINPKTKHKFGFAWVCLNDARKVLKNKEIRGLLVKKYGFSISDRSFLESFFGRTVFNRRITGEVIVQDKALLPNAARSDFESSIDRDEFFYALTELTKNISKWAENIQNELKATEELDEITPRTFEINEQLPSSRRDYKELLSLHVELTEIRKRMMIHKKTLIRIKKDDFNKTFKVLEINIKTVEGFLIGTKSNKEGSYASVRRSVELEDEAPSEENLVYDKDIPRNLTDLIDSMDIIITEPMKIVINYIEEEIIKPNLSEDEYIIHLKYLRDRLEEKI